MFFALFFTYSEGKYTACQVDMAVWVVGNMIPFVNWLSFSPMDVVQRICSKSQVHPLAVLH